MDLAPGDVGNYLVDLRHRSKALCDASCPATGWEPNGADKPPQPNDESSWTQGPDQPQLSTLMWRTLAEPLGGGVSGVRVSTGSDCPSQRRPRRRVAFGVLCGQSCRQNPEPL